MLSTILDLLGAACLIGFAYLLFPPAALAVAGFLCLAASYRKAGK
jgi:hypothetical protein